MTQFIPKIAIIGPSGSGKDFAGEWLGNNTLCKYKGSLSNYMNPIVAKKLKMSEELCWADKRKYSNVWYKVGNVLRVNDDVAVMRMAVNEGVDIYTGIRNRNEWKRSVQYGWINLTIWIERPNAIDDTTLELSKNDADIVIMNDSTSTAYTNKLSNLAKSLNIYRTRLLDSQ